MGSGYREIGREKIFNYNPLTKITANINFDLISVDFFRFLILSSFQQVTLP